MELLLPGTFVPCVDFSLPGAKHPGIEKSCIRVVRLKFRGPKGVRANGTVIIYAWRYSTCALQVD